MLRLGCSEMGISLSTRDRRISDCAVIYKSTEKDCTVFIIKSLSVFALARFNLALINNMQLLFQRINKIQLLFENLSRVKKGWIPFAT